MSSAAALPTASRIHRLRVAVVLTALLIIGGCTRRQPLETRLSDSRTQLRHGDLKHALATAVLAEREWGVAASSDSGWRVRLAKAEALIAIGEYEAALECLAPRPPSGAGVIAASRLMHQAQAHYRLGRYPEARDLLSQALAAAPENATELLADIHLRRGPVLARLGEASEADAAVRLSLALAKSAGDPYLQAAALGNLGFTRLQLLREDEAIPLFEEALVLSEKAGARRFTASLQGNLGRCYYGLGDVERSVALLSAAERGATALQDVMNAQVWLGVLGDVHYELKRDFPAALQYYRRALDLARQLGDAYQIASQLYNITALSIASGDLQSAEQYHRETDRFLADHKLPQLSVWHVLASAGLAAAKGDAASAEAAYRAALGDATRLGYAQLGWFAHAGLAELAAVNNRPEQAHPEFEAALRGIELARSRLAREGWMLTFQERVTQFYRAYVDFLMNRGEIGRALEIAEASRARLLAHKLRLDTEELDIVPAARFREHASASRSALVSFWLAPRKSYVWVVTPGAIHAAELPGDAEIRGLIESYTGVIQGGRDPLRTASAAGDELASLLLSPLARMAPDADRFIVVPDGALYELNPEALPSPGQHGRYWIEDATVVLSPSLALLSLRPKAAGRDSLLLIGNPEPPTPEYAPLPAAAEEIAALRKRFVPEIHEGAAAHPGAYLNAKPARFSLIHLAAHADANRQSPLESAVILSRKGDRFKLYARDVIDIPIRARLVTISACRSASGRVYSGEGLVGFTWAFLRAGAQNVVAGLWDVNDASTARLMDSLYAEIAAGRTPADALRDAKLALVRSDSAWRKPYYWAPFQIFSRNLPF